MEIQPYERNIHLCLEVPEIDERMVSQHAMTFYASHHFSIGGFPWQVLCKYEKNAEHYDGPALGIYILLLKEKFLDNDWLCHVDSECFMKAPNSGMEDALTLTMYNWESTNQGGYTGIRYYRPWSRVLEYMAEDRRVHIELSIRVDKDKSMQAPDDTIRHKKDSSRRSKSASNEAKEREAKAKDMIDDIDVHLKLANAESTIERQKDTISEFREKLTRLYDCLTKVHKLAVEPIDQEQAEDDREARTSISAPSSTFSGEGWPVRQRDLETEDVLQTSDGDLLDDLQGYLIRSPNHEAETPTPSIGNGSIVNDVMDSTIGHWDAAYTELNATEWNSELVRELIELEERQQHWNSELDAIDSQWNPELAQELVELEERQQRTNDTQVPADWGANWTTWASPPNPWTEELLDDVNDDNSSYS